MSEYSSLLSDSICHEFHNIHIDSCIIINFYIIRGTGTLRMRKCHVTYSAFSVESAFVQIAVCIIIE